jgi:para-aminobenzoate synthetase / 4-amino-4-deoxychorismate lyase
MTLEFTNGPDRERSGAAVVLSGAGPRSWPAVEGAVAHRPAELAWLLPHEAVAARASLRLSCDPAQARVQAAELLDLIDAQHALGRAAAGYLGYEVGAALEGIAPLKPDASAPPDAELVFFDPTCLQLSPLRPVNARQCQRIDRAVRAAHDQQSAAPHNLIVQRTRFERSVLTALDRISAGDVYQVNVTVAFGVTAPGALRRCPLLRLADLQQRVQPVPLGMAFDGSSHRLVSGSMERFVSVRGGRVRSRPIKGTALRGADELSDELLRSALESSPKERAENTMIVDMMRNDLSRVATLGSVKVEELLETVAYETLWHLESEVSATLPAQLAASSLLKATLPPASVTGCPKISAMRLIRALERRRRGPYCGAIGVSFANGDCDWSVGIRLLSVRTDNESNEMTASIDVGAGIVADSDPAAEWRETCAKAESALVFVNAVNHLTASVDAAHGPNKLGLRSFA